MDAANATFQGTFTPRLDDKGRLTLPAQFRSLVAGGIVLTRGQEHCVFGWTPQNYAALAEKVRQLPFTHAGARNFSRMFFSGASDAVPDKQGRVAIPTTLRTWAHLDRECTVVGVMDRFEIWDTQRWNDFELEQEPDFADMSEEVMPGIF